MKSTLTTVLLAVAALMSVPFPGSAQGNGDNYIWIQATCDSTLDYDYSGGQITLFGDSYTSLDYSDLPFGYDYLEAGVNVELDGPYGPIREAWGAEPDYVEVEIAGTAWTTDARYAIYGDHFYQVNDINYDLGPTGASVYVPAGGGGPTGGGCSEPAIDNVNSSDDWQAGNSISFTVSGSCFGSSPSLTVGGYVPGTLSFWADPSTPDTTIYGSLTIDPNATEVSFTVTTWGGGLGYLPGGGGTSSEYDVPVEPAPVCAKPQNFVQPTPGVESPPGSGQLVFQYYWQSSTGNLADLGACHIREHVELTGLDSIGTPPNVQYFLPSPPFPRLKTDNPVDTDDPPTTGAGGDTVGAQLTPADFVRPYSYRAVSGTQVFQYKCFCANNGDWTNLTQPIGILFSVTQQNGVWVYNAIKANIPPASTSNSATTATIVLGK